MTSITELVERLERAEGPSRELDAEIHQAVWGEPIAAEIEDWHKPYTASVDCALTLVPEGVSAQATKLGNGRGHAEIWTYASQRFALLAIKMEVGGEMRLRGREPLKWRSGQLLVFKDRRPLGTMTQRELARAESAACNLPEHVLHHQNVGAATPALALCIASLKARAAI